MFLVRKSFITRLALILAFMGGLLNSGTVKPAEAAAQAGTSSSQTCEPGSGWEWASGSLRPDIAQQAEEALAQQGTEASVVAKEYGERDSCGNFELFSV